MGGRQAEAPGLRGRQRALCEGPGGEIGFDVCAIESDPYLRDRIASSGVTSHFSLSATNQSEFDGVYTLNVLEHIQDDEEMLRQLADRIRPGGGLFVYVSAFPILFSANDERVGHCRRYRRTELTRKIERVGLRVESARYVDCIGFAAGLAYRLLGNRDGGLDPRAIRFYDRFLFPISLVFDRIAGHFFGKNLLVLARKRADPIAGHESIDVRP